MDILRIISLIAVLSVALIVPYSENQTDISAKYDRISSDCRYDICDVRNIEEDTKDTAAKSSIKIIGKTDKNPLTYKVGETMTFTVSAISDKMDYSFPAFAYELEGDDGQKSSGIVPAVNGTAEITATCSVPGYVYLRVYPSDGKEKIAMEDTVIFDGGACAGFEDITKSQPEPSDFDLFWSRQTALLDDISAKASKFIEFTNHKYSDYNIYDVSIPCISDSRPTSGFVCIPKNADDGSLKIKVIYMGYGIASAIISPQPGYITFCINPHGIDNGMNDVYYTALSENDLSNFGFSDNSIPENSYFRNMILRDIQGIRYIKNAFAKYWNGKDIEVRGASMGAFQASAVAALMPDDITKVTLEIPWMCDLGSEQYGRLAGWRPTYTQGLGYYDTVSFGKRIKAQTEIIAGLGDYICPPSGVTALYNSLNCLKNITFTQNMTHDRNPELKLSYSLP